VPWAGFPMAALMVGQRRLTPGRIRADRAWFLYLKFKYDERLSNFAFTFHWRPYFMDLVGVKSTAKYVLFETFIDKDVSRIQKSYSNYPWCDLTNYKYSSPRHPAFL